MDPVVTLKCRTRMVAVTMIVGVLVVTVVVMVLVTVFLGLVEGLFGDDIIALGYLI